MAGMSKSAITFALEDAKADILEMAKLLESIAYPRRGSKEEQMTLQEFADLIADKFTEDDLSQI